MAKEKKFVKLGATASLFSDATTGFKLVPGEVKELKPTHKASKRIAKAIKHGHIEYCEELIPQLDGDLEIQDNSKKASGDWKDLVEYEPGKLKKLTKEQLVELAIYNESDYTEEELRGFNKDEIVDEIFELREEEDEE